MWDVEISWFKKKFWLHQHQASSKWEIINYLILHRNKLYQYWTRLNIGEIITIISIINKLKCRNNYLHVY